MTKPRDLDLFEHAAHKALVESARDLLEHPRHTISAKDRRYLRAVLRRELEEPGSTHE